MRFVTFESSGEARLGVVAGDDVIELSAVDPSAPATLLELIANGGMAGLESKISSASPAARRPVAGVKLLPPIPSPGKIICVGLNYHDHAKELGESPPDYPAIFTRTTTSLAGAGEPMIVPRISAQLDFEAELVIVIGARCRHVSEKDALEHVFGYTCFNEGTVRDYQHKSSQWTVAKNFDKTGPMGPWVVTADEVPPGADGLRIRTTLNGDVVQDANTSLMIFSVQKIISLLSQIMTLEPGDLISTGTPAGVGVGRTPQVWLKPGDTVVVDIESVGVLTSLVAHEDGADPLQHRQS